MEESKALNRLIEAQDLVGMIEDLLSPATLERLSSSSWSGVRITLKNIKEIIQSSHSALAADLVHRSRALVGSGNGAVVSSPGESQARPENHPPGFTMSATNEPPRIQMTRKDLKASLEKLIER